MARFLLWLLVCAGPVSAALLPTTTSVSLVSGAPVYGVAMSFHAHVNAASGSITFIVDGQAGTTKVVDSTGGADITLTPQAGSHTIGATFSGNDVYQSSTATLQSIVVAKAATIVGVSAGTAQIGQPVNITATAAIPGYGPPSGGTMAFAPAPECGAVPVVYGVAVCTVAYGVVSSIPITASFSGDANTLPSSASYTITVGKAIPHFYVTSSPIVPLWGISAIISTLVQGNDSLGVPTGTVTFFSGSKSIGIQAVGPDGRAAFSSIWAVGTYAITAVYGGDGYYQASPAVGLTLTVSKAPVTLTVSADPAQVGQPVMLYASAVLAAGSGAISGTVDFSIAGKAVSGCTGLNISTGTASCQTTLSQMGTFALGGSYSGDANSSPASGAATVTVGKAVPGITLAQSPAAPLYGQPVTVSCLVMGAANTAVPTGTVTFSSGAKSLATQPVDSDGRASFSSTWSPGASTITAVYNGDTNYQASAPASLTVTVAKAAVVLTVSADPAQAGQPTVLRASVSYASGSGTITGTVDFTIGGKAVTGCTGVALASGAASCPTVFAQMGTFTLGGSFSGDANNLPATASVNITVNKTAPGIYLAQSPAGTVFGQPVTIDAFLPVAAGVSGPTGMVTFSDGGQTIASQLIRADGHASFATALTVGLHTITAAYGGDNNYQPTSSAPMAVSVAQAATATTLTAVTGGPFTAILTVIAPGAGLPTGNVQFRSGTALIGSAPLVAQGSSFTAVLATSTATGGISAQYQGDGNFASSSSGTVTVNAVQSLVTVTSDHNPGTAGQPVNFTVVVSLSPQSMATIPTGSITLSAEGSNLGTATLANGQSALSAILAAGSHTVTARYSGDASCPTASGTLLQVVNAAATALTVSSSAPVAVVGQPVTLTALLPAQSGNVQFTDSGTSLGAAPITTGTATLPVNLAAGTHTITATWAGDGTWAAATAQLVQTVNKAATTISVGISGNTMVATVAVTAPGAGSPGGTVRFLDAATSSALYTIPLTGASAPAPQPATADSVVAIYSGDANFLGSTSATLHLLTVTNAASYVSGSLAPDELVTLFGPNLAGATSVKVTDNNGTAHPAALFFVSATQASILMPANLTAGAATVSITSPTRTLSAPITVTAVSPGLFTADGTGQGAPAAQVITMNPDGTPGDPKAATGAIDVSGGAVYLVLYGTGIRHATTPVCTIAGHPAQLLYAGAQGTMAGLDQVNVLIPASLRGSGAVTLNLTVDGNAANAVTLAIQ